MRDNREDDTPYLRTLIFATTIRIEEMEEKSIIIRQIYDN